MYLQRKNIIPTIVPTPIIKGVLLIPWQKKIVYLIGQPIGTYQYIIEDVHGDSINCKNHSNKKMTAD